MQHVSTRWQGALRLSLLLLGSFGASDAVRAQDVPFAQGGTTAQVSTGLSEIMLSVAQRHAMLWFAGSSGNWSFAAYEVAQLRARFVEAASAYRNIPVDIVVAMTKAMDEVQAAVGQKNKAQFGRAFDAATRACNACHAAAGLEFVQVRRPVSVPLSNLQWGQAAAP